MIDVCEQGFPEVTQFEDVSTSDLLTQCFFCDFAGLMDIGNITNKLHV